MRLAWSGLGRRAAPRLVIGCVAVAAALGPGCRLGGGPTAPEKPPPVYAAVGASESVGVGAADPAAEAWTQVFRRTALPPRTVFTNLAVEGVNTAEALAQQVPRAVALEPTVVTVWLNVNDIVDRVPPERFEQQLTELVRQLRRGGQTKVLVANTPEVDELPAVARLGPIVAALADRAVDAYNEATGRVVAAEGAVLVDLHGASEQAEREGRFARLVAADGFHPSTEGHAEVARMFALALRDSGGLG